MYMTTAATKEAPDEVVKAHFKPSAAELAGASGSSKYQPPMPVAQRINMAFFRKNIVGANRTAKIILTRLENDDGPMVHGLPSVLYTSQTVADWIMKAAQTHT
jgi:hypothetical protein